MTSFSQKKNAGGLHLGTPLLENTTKSRKNEYLPKKDVFFSKKNAGGLHLGTPLLENTKTRKNECFSKKDVFFTKQKPPEACT